MLEGSSISSRLRDSAIIGHTEIKRNISSTQYHRRVQRANAASQVAGTVLAEIAVTAAIPSKLMQTVLSGYAFFMPNLRPVEYTAHAVQASLAFVQLSLLIFLFIKDDTCQSNTASLGCKSLIISDLLYQGTLLMGWIPAEAFKQPQLPITPNQITEPEPIGDIESQLTEDTAHRELSLFSPASTPIASSDEQHSVESAQSNDSANRYSFGLF